MLEKKNAEAFLWFQEKKKPRHTCFDAYPIYDSDPCPDAQQLIGDMMKELFRPGPGANHDIQRAASGQKILEGSDTQKVEALIASLIRANWNANWKSSDSKEFQCQRQAQALMKTLIEQPLRMSAENAQRILPFLTASSPPLTQDNAAFDKLWRLLYPALKSVPLSPQCHDALRKMSRARDQWYKRAIQQMGELLSGVAKKVAPRRASVPRPLAIHTLKERLARNEMPESTGADGFPIYADDPTRNIHLKISRGLPVLATQWEINSKPFIKAPENERLLTIKALLVRTLWFSGDFDEDDVRAGCYFALEDLLGEMLSSEHSFSDIDLAEVLGALIDQRADLIFRNIWAGILLQIQTCIAQSGMTPVLQNSLETLKQKMPCDPRCPAGLRVTKEINDLLGKKTILWLDSEDAWASAALKDIAAMPATERTAWTALLTHARELKQAKPGKAWLAEANKQLQAVKPQQFSQRAQAWLAECGRGSAAQQMGAVNADFLRGIVWYCTLVRDDAMTRTIGDVALACFKKIPNFGPRCVKGANACMAYLKGAHDLQSVTQLGRLKIKTTYGTVKSKVDTSLEDAATKAGMPKEDLEEISLPSCGLDADGRLHQDFGDVKAELRIASSTRAEIEWRGADGALLPSVPAKAKQQTEALKQVKDAKREVEKVLPVIRSRFEQSFLTERQWPVDDWRKRFLDHPLAGFLARRLIWRFDMGKQIVDGMWLRDGLVDVQERPLEVSPNTRVSLWHPLHCRPQEVLAWRTWIEKHEITQPIKQAYREIYVLTDAERRTDLYSNRFAAHIIRQHPFNALCQQRNWSNGLQGDFDSGYVPTRTLPGGLRAEFWIERMENSPLTHHGIFVYLSTDQVRFTRESGEQLPLAQIPPLLFSEVMRDVDLFVGVCSVGNDPEWRDQGLGNDRYWHEYAFGELSVSAATRRDVLQRLLPRLAIAARCSIADKYMVVRGDLRTYKIHLGSGNVLMEPNDQYLCIVQGRGESASNLFLPFEGDHMLAVILSKAFLLAADTKIKDASILSQMRS